MPGREKVLGYRTPEEGWKRVQSAAGPLRRSRWILGWSEPVLGREGERKWAVPVFSSLGLPETRRGFQGSHKNLPSPGEFVDRPCGYQQSSPPA